MREEVRLIHKLTIAGLSLRGIARWVGVSATTVSFWYAGKRAAKPKHLAALRDLQRTTGERRVGRRQQTSR